MVTFLGSTEPGGAVLDAGSTLRGREREGLCRDGCRQGPLPPSMSPRDPGSGSRGGGLQEPLEGILSGPFHLQDPTNGEMSQRRQGPRLRSPGCVGTQIHGPTVLAICLRSILLSVGSVCSQLLRGGGLWLLGTCRLDALNLRCCDLSERQTGAGCFPKGHLQQLQGLCRDPHVCPL